MSKRLLTAGEIALARTMFGDSIDYAAVRLYNRRILPPLIQHKHQAVAHADNISFPRSAYSDDFSRETDAKKQSVFIHELTHVWQHQNGIVSTTKEAIRETLRHKFNYAKCYLYDLNAGKDLTAYNFEQQAAIVQDYFPLTHHGTTQSFKNRRLTQGDAASLKKAYDAVLGNFLKNPGYAQKTCRKPAPPKP
ncbi:MAG: hypothetical protein JWQ32_3555 [Marmoricola sp.]|nr:hypothetical protein [Marmoricola sp.]